MLKMWSAADAGMLTKTFGVSLKAFRPHVPEHKFVPLAADESIPQAAVGDVVLVAGKRPLEVMQKAGFAPKGRTVTSLRETPLKSKMGGWYMVTFDPGVIQSESDKKEVIDWDLRLAVRLMQTGSLEPPVGDYKWVASYDDMIEWIEARYEERGKPVDVSMDTETMGLYPWYADKDFVSISFTARPDTAEMLYLGPLQAPLELDTSSPLFDQISWLLTSPKVRLRMANGKFDLIWVKEKWGLDCTNFAFDTLLVGSLLDENRTNSLNLHAKIMTPLGGYDDAFNKTVDKAHMEKVPPEKLRVYQGGDTDACQQVADLLRDQLAQDHELTRFYLTILHPAARAFEKVERRGVLVDQQKMHVLADDLKKVIKEATDKQLSILPHKMKIKYRDRIDKQLKDGKNPVLPSILHEFFFTPHGLNLKPKELTEKTKEPSMKKSHLRQFADTSPDAAAMIEAMTIGDGAAKTLSTFVDGFLRHLRPDGRFHPSYMLFKGGFNDDEDDESGTVCVTADALFMTDRGQIPFKEVRVGDRVVSHVGVPRSVVALVDNGVKPVLRVVLAGNYALECTFTHPFRVGSGWVRADELTPGDEVSVLPEQETWLPVEGWPFKVSNWGRVCSAKGTMLQQYRKGRWGHLKVCLFRNGSQKRGNDRRDFAIHRLVAEAFIANPGGLPEVRHRNGIAWDNQPNNLEWGTTADNRKDMRRHGTGRGAHANQAKVTWKCVAQMRASTRTDSDLASEFGVSRELVRDIRAFKRWVARPLADRVVFFSTSAVLSVEYIGDLPTFGVTVEDDHSHVTNGIVTHNTGRLSAKDPAFQTMPKKTKWAKRIRECYPAPPGKAVLSCDYSQGELKVVACVAPEKTMIASYEQGLDLHAVTGAALAKVDLKEFLSWKDNEDKARADMFEKHRGNAKPANFGLLYGMGAEGFMAYAWANYGIKLALAEATQMRNAFFELYPGLLGFHDKQRELVKAHKMVRSPLGRIRHLPMIDSWDRGIKSKAERQSINSPIQSCLSDMMIWSIARIEQEFPNGEIEVVGMIHDALVAYVDADKVQSLAGQVVKLMAGLPLAEVGWSPQLRFTADAEAGPDLANMKKLKFAA